MCVCVGTESYFVKRTWIESNVSMYIWYTYIETKLRTKKNKRMKKTKYINSFSLFFFVCVCVCFNRWSFPSFFFLLVPFSLYGPSDQLTNQPVNHFFSFIHSFIHFKLILSIRTKIVNRRNSNKKSSKFYSIL